MARRADTYRKDVLSVILKRIGTLNTRLSTEPEKYNSIQAQKAALASLLGEVKAIKY